LVDQVYGLGSNRHRTPERTLETAALDGPVGALRARAQVSAAPGQARFRVRHDGVPTTHEADEVGLRA
jgi:hypothetical protein